MFDSMLRSVRQLIILGIIGCLTATALAQPGNSLEQRGDQLMSLEFVDADLKHVLRLIAKQNQLNIITNDQLSGTVTVNFQEVTLKGALEAILVSNGYNYVIKDNIIIVKERGQRMLGEVETRVYEFDYIEAPDAISALSNVVTSEHGEMEIFRRSKPGGSNQTTTRTSTGGSKYMVITDVPDNFPQIEDVIDQIDVPVPQVMIAVKFIETRLDHEDTRGINWTVKARLQGGPPQSRTGTTTGGTGTTVGGTGTTGGIGTGSAGFPVFGEYQSLDVATLNLQEFQAVLEMLFTKGNSRLLSDPRITTLDNQAATIEVGTTVPVLVPQQQGAQGGGVSGFGFVQNTFEDIDINISLRVLPRVNPNRYITMSVEPLVEAITGYSGPDQDRPIVASRSAQTQVMIKDGETIAIGGLIKEDKFETYKKVPILGDIPLVGRLFQYKSKQTEKTDLIIFITPNIVGPVTQAQASTESGRGQ
ncbi:MAG: secretin and TonB N-terminal domain-containing protein [Candidatus Marinimicrobia bacterium]|nr:secretin and TonB N-terminal domain-containing protein [Candidatus Neomarinimicrobiota bacterium]MCF7830178.1 secretin and TonB N-terminal domain-containing protein [Candidatus Neomarinimicrobiota bacterium]MCF7882088.1 secretin and TonB N-terminal domain-containing protein [Candidatus Neomarinimicrobiota bacterium]